MTLENLQLFRDIAQAKSVSRGAELNGITPSAATQQIQELERTLGVELLDRSTRPISLTSAGRIYQDFCRDALRRWEQFEAALAESRAAVEGTVRVASIYSVGLAEMGELEDEFSRRVPSVKLEIKYLRPEKVYEAVLEDRADLGLVSYPESTREIAATPWRLEEMVLATAPGHALSRQESVTAVDLAGVDFIAFDDELPIRREIDRYLRSHEVAANIVMQFDNLQTIKEAVMLDTGVSIVPKRILRAEIADGRLIAVPLAAPGLYRPVGIIHRKKKKLHRAAQMFFDLLRDTPAPEASVTLAPA